MTLRRLIATLLAPLALAACATVPAEAPRPPAAAKGMVSAADPRAAEAGAEMLRAGGSATDAAIATMLALTVVEPQSSGIGGGGFYVSAAPDGSIETIDGRETAPAGAGPDWFLGEDGQPLAHQKAVESGLSVGVPGNIALAAEAHRRAGKLAWKELFAPAIRLASEGWTISERSRAFLLRARSTAARDPAGRALFFGADGNPVPTGTRVRNPELAQTLRRIAEGGKDAFYRGPFAAMLAQAAAADTPGLKRPTGGKNEAKLPGGRKIELNWSGWTAGRQPMQPEDLAAYRAKARPTVCGTYRLHRICGMGPPSSGATTVLAILGQLERFDLAALGKDSPTFWHLFAESQRLAYADRERFLADPDFIAVPTAELIAPAYLARRSALIDPAKTMEAPKPGLDLPPPDGMEPPENGTSHFVVIDRAGNAVSYTSTIESAFGSGLMAGGFYLTNELTDFSFVPAVGGEPVANRVEAGKRPRSSMAPTLVFAPDGSLMMALGAAGGATIPVQVSKVLIGVIDLRLSLDEALALPVLFSPGETVFVEPGTSLVAMIPGLQALGHSDTRPRELPLKANAAIRTATGWKGAADPRSEGAAVTE